MQRKQNELQEHNKARELTSRLQDLVERVLKLSLHNGVDKQACDLFYALRQFALSGWPPEEVEEVLQHANRGEYLRILREFAWSMEAHLEQEFAARLVQAT